MDGSFPRRQKRHRVRLHKSTFFNIWPRNILLMLSFSVFTAPDFLVFMRLTSEGGHRQNL